MRPMEWGGTVIVKVMRSTSPVLLTSVKSEKIKVSRLG